MPLSEALESNNAEMNKRLKYTKEILTHMHNNNTTSTRGSSQNMIQSITERRPDTMGI
jgi:polo-like kinase 1